MNQTLALLPEKITEKCGLEYSANTLQSILTNLPWQELEWCKDNKYVLVAGPPYSLTVQAIREKISPKMFYSNPFVPQTWYKRNEHKPDFFREDIVCPDWLMTPKGIFPGSTNKSWEEQQKIPSPQERIVNAAEALWVLTAWKSVYGEHFVSNMHIRTSSVTSNDWPVMVGVFGGKIHITSHWPRLRTDYIGILTTRCK